MLIRVEVLWTALLWHSLNFNLQKLTFFIDNNFGKRKQILLDLLKNSLIEIFMESWLKMKTSKKLFATKKIFSLRANSNKSFLITQVLVFLPALLVSLSSNPIGYYDTKQVFLRLFLFKAVAKIEFWWPKDYIKMFQNSQENGVLGVTCGCCGTVIRQLYHQYHQTMNQS